MKHLILHHPNGTLDTFSLIGKQTVAQTLWTDGRLVPPPLCSGLGKCGHCQVQFIAKAPPVTTEEQTYFTSEALEKGWRLACRHNAEDGMEIRLFLGTEESHPKKGIESIYSQQTSCAKTSSIPTPVAEAITPATTPLKATPHQQIDNIPSSPALQGQAPFQLAVDLGTTSLHWSLIDSTGQECATGAMLNPQMGAGSDVMSRIAYAQTSQGRQTLQRLVINALRAIIDTLGVADSITECCIAGNTAMTAIMADVDMHTLAAAPYEVPFAGGTSIALPNLPPVWIPPQPAPFIGGDVSAGYSALLAHHPIRYPFLLADLGTNGEFVLALSEEHSILTSIPLGPALEGIGLRHGTVATPGVITEWTLSPFGLQPQRLPFPEGTVAPPVAGISGTGYLSLLHTLLRAGVLDEQGHFIQCPPSPLARRISNALQRIHGELHLPLGDGIDISSGDIEEVIKVKATFSLALKQLLGVAEISVNALSQIYIAGSLGRHVAPHDLTGLGFIPAESESRIIAIGNASLDGAKTLLTTPHMRTTIQAWVRHCERVEQTELDNFTKQFLEHMRFSF